MNAPTSSNRIARIGSAIGRFFAAPASPAPLGVLRIGVAAILLAQALALSGNMLDLYGPRGIVQWPLTDSLALPFVPRVGWVVDAAAHFGFSDDSAVRGLFALYVGAVSCLLIGYGTRTTSVVTWLTHLTLKTSAVATVYGVDSFAHIMLFYFMFMPIGRAFSVDRLLGRTSGEATSGARLALRVVQLHLCVVYFTSGFEKALGPDWWDGEAIWCTLMRSDLCSLDMSWMSQVPWLPTLIGWSTLALEMGYAALVWPRATRKLTAAATIGMHLGIAVMLGLVSFAALMSVFTLAAFMIGAEPKEEAAPRWGLIPGLPAFTSSMGC